MRQSLIVAAILLLSLNGSGADYFPYKARKLTYDFEVPFDAPGAPKLKPAKIVVQSKPDAGGNYSFGFLPAQITSIEIQMGDSRLTVPPAFLQSIGPMNPSVADFYWVGMRHYLVMTRPHPDDRTKTQSIQFIFDTAGIADVRIDRVSQWKHLQRLLPQKKNDSKQ